MSDSRVLNEGQVEASLLHKVDATLTESARDKVKFVKTQDTTVVYVVSDEGPSQFLGCSLCFEEELTDRGETSFIGERAAIPVSSVSNDVDDSRHPLAGVLFFCPSCNRMLIHPDSSKAPIIGRMEMP